MNVAGGAVLAVGVVVCAALASAGDPYKEYGSRNEQHARLVAEQGDPISLTVAERRQRQGATSANDHKRRGLAFLEKGDLDRAIAEFTKAIDINPKDADAYAHRAYAFGEKDDYDREISDWTKVIEIYPKAAYAYLQRGLAYGEKDDLDRAIADYTKALSINPNYIEAYGSRGVVHLQKRDWDRARDDFLYTVAISAKSPSEQEMQKLARKTLKWLDR
jgi:tetratricopeptide (TPR) repeat protein